MSLKENEFQCHNCKGIFEKARTDEEALQEHDKYFGKEMTENTEGVWMCGDCFEFYHPEKHPDKVENAKKFFFKMQFLNSRPDLGPTSFLGDKDISPLEELLLQDGKIIPVFSTELYRFTQEEISLFCLKHGVYQLPTVELLDFLAEETTEGLTIEIGAGNGCIGRALGILMVDNKMQSWGEVKKYYNALHQPTIIYGEDVKERHANNAVRKWRPHNIIGCWITEKHIQWKNDGNMYGPNEIQMFEDGIKKYIHVGNELTAAGKEILKKRPYKKLKFPWLISRSMSREENVIYIIE